MYGYTTGGVDIPAGTVYGLSVRTLLYPGGITVTEKNLMSVPVGLNAINCNPSHE
jgi:hypothetical protein